MLHCDLPIHSFNSYLLIIVHMFITGDTVYKLGMVLPSQK